MRIEKRNIDELFPADYNPRKALKAGDPEYEKLKRSIETFGLVEPIIFNEDTGRVIGGHQRQTVLKDMGFTEVEVSIVNLSEDEEKALNVALNKISGEWDYNKLTDLLNDLQMSSIDATLTGFDSDEIKAMLLGDDFGDEEESAYTEKVEIPVYEPTSTIKPEFNEMYNYEKAMKLILKIESANISEEEKRFLKMAAYRHVDFNYRAIAEFYCHSDKEIQELMEESALVIIDFNKAIENGFVEFTKEVMNSQGEDDDEE